MVDDFVLMADDSGLSLGAMQPEHGAQQALDEEPSGGIGSLHTNQMVRDDDDPCPTVSTSVMAGNEPPGVDDHEPAPGAEGVDAEPTRPLVRAALG